METDTMIDYAGLARQGATLLDGRAPQWWKVDGATDVMWTRATGPISLDDLDLSDDGSCVLGQMYGSWSNSPNSLKWQAPFIIDPPAPAFEAPGEEWARFHEQRNAMYAALTGAWRAEIMRRRDADQ